MYTQMHILGFTLYHETHCNTLQHAATHCNTLQHTATHCNTLHILGFTLYHVSISVSLFLSESVWVCMRASERVSVWACGWERARESECMCVCVRVRARMWMCVYARVCVCAHACVCVCVCVWGCVCVGMSEWMVCVCVRDWVGMVEFTYIHEQTSMHPSHA